MSKPIFEICNPDADPYHWSWRLIEPKRPIDGSVIVADVVKQLHDRYRKMSVEEILQAIHKTVRG